MKTLIKLMDIKTLTAGIIPVALGTVYSWHRFSRMSIAHMLLLMFAIVLLQSCANMINDLFDYTRGADSSDKAHEKALASGETTPGQVKGIIMAFLLVDLGIAVYFSWLISWLILVVCLAGGMIMYFYSAGSHPISHTPFGELAAGGTMGLGIMSTVIYIQSGTVDGQTLLVTLPTSLYIGTILLTNNISDNLEDKAVGRRTLPIIIGIPASERLWQIICWSLPAVTAVFYIAGYWPIECLLLALIAFPYRAVWGFRRITKSAANKGQLMGLINIVGLRYHLAVTAGMLVSHLY